MPKVIARLYLLQQRLNTLKAGIGQLAIVGNFVGPTARFCPFLGFTSV
jgi:hypothetical protein